MITLGNVSHANSTSPKTFLNSSIDGELVSIGIANGMNVHHFAVNIDTNQVIRADNVSDFRFHSSQSYGGGEGNNGLSFDSKFDSLNIEIWDGKAPAAETRYWCIFKIDPAHLPMDKDEFIERWKRDSDEGDDETGDDLLTFDDEREFVHERYFDEDGEEFLSLSRGRKRHAMISIDSDTLKPEEDTLSGKITCTNWRDDPIEFTEELLPLELRRASHESVLEELNPRIQPMRDFEGHELGVREFEVTLPRFVRETSGSWTLSTHLPEWANYRANFTAL